MIYITHGSYYELHIWVVTRLQEQKTPVGYEFCPRRGRAAMFYNPRHVFIAAREQGIPCLTHIVVLHPMNGSGFI